MCPNPASTGNIVRRASKHGQVSFPKFKGLASRKTARGGEREGIRPLSRWHGGEAPKYRTTTHAHTKQIVGAFLKEEGCCSDLEAGRAHHPEAMDEPVVGPGARWAERTHARGEHFDHVDGD